MTEKWESVPLGAVTTQVKDVVTLRPGFEYRLLGLRMYGGGMIVRATTTASTSKAATLWRARTGQFVYSRLWSRAGAFGVVPPEMDGSLLSNEFPVYNCDESRISAQFLWLHFQQPSVWNDVARDNTGSIATRTRWKEKEFSAHRILLPPIPVQERIVEVIGAIDDQIAALDAEARALGTVVASLLDNIASVEDTKPLGDLCATIGSGPSWTAADESALPSSASLPVIKITNTRPDGSLDLSEITHVSGLPARTRVIGPTSLVMIRTNGNRNRIGNVYMPPAEAHGYAVSAFQFIVEANDQDTREYLYVALRSPRLQRLMSENASGSTGLGNLAVRWLKTLEMPWPAAPIRNEKVAMVRDLDASLAAIRNESDRLRTVRSALLTALLNRDVEIEDTEEAVA